MSEAPSESPHVEVVIPVYNGAETVGATLQSLLDQTYPHWTARVFDNASTDGTRDIVAGFADPRISLENASEHMDITANWQRCLTGLRGDYVQLLSADDALHEECLAAKVAVAAKPAAQDAVLITSNRRLIGADGSERISLGFSKEQRIFGLRDFVRKSAFILNPIGDPSTGLMRASALRGFSFSGKYTWYIDVEMWLHILKQGAFVHVPRDLSYYRVSGKALGGAGLLVQYRQFVEFYREQLRPLHASPRLLYISGYAFHAARLLVRRIAYLLWGRAS